MKIQIHIILTGLILFVCSCSTSSHLEDELPTDPETRSIIMVEIEEESALANKLETVRFLVFNNIYSSPTLEYNDIYTIPTASEGNEVSKFKITLELDASVGLNEHRIVVAIVNEPSTIKNELDGLTSYSQLDNIQLNMEDFLNVEHNDLKSNKTMPMSGAILTKKSYAKPMQAENNPVRIVVQRVVARVEVYVRKENGQQFSLGDETSVTLRNTYDKAFLIYHESNDFTLGRIPTIDPTNFLTRDWTIQPSDPTDIPVDATGRLLCAFYTPERTSEAANNADKLILDININTNEYISGSAEVIIDKFKLNGVEKEVNKIERNNMYRVIVTIGKDAIIASVVGWNNEDIPVEL